MDTPEEARDYDGMDHRAVNAAFVDELLSVLEASPLAGRLNSADSPVQILDSGTGTALIPIEFCRRGGTAQITAIDLAGEMLALARRNVERAGAAGRIRLERCDGKKLPFADGSFDAVMSNSIVHHIPEPIEAVREMVRVLRPGGLLFVRDLLRPASADAVETLVQQYAGEENPHSQQMFRQSLHAALTVDEVQGLLLDLGLPAAWVTQTTDRHWTISGATPSNS